MTDPVVGHLERRVEDLEDTVAAALGHGLVDDLTARVEELGVLAVTHDDLLKVRTDVARLAAEITRLRADLHAELDDLAAAIVDLGDARRPHRQAG